MDVWDEIAAGRREMADYLETLDDKAWDTPSLCRGWNVRDVAGHLVMPLTTSVPKIVMRTIGSLSFDKANDKMAREIGARSTPKEIAAILRREAENKFKPPSGTPEMPLADLVIHSGDIRRPLNAPSQMPGNRAETVLNFLAHGRTRAFVEKNRLAGLRFEATDIDWNSGTDGKLVRGPAEALIMAMSGRDAALDDLEGDGVEVLRSR